MHVRASLLLSVALVAATSARTLLDDDDLGIHGLNPVASYKDVCETIGRRLRNSSAIHYPGMYFQANRACKLTLPS